MSSIDIAKVRGLPHVLVAMALAAALGCDDGRPVIDGGPDATAIDASRSDGSVDAGVLEHADAAIEGDGGVAPDAGPPVDGGPRPWPDEINTGVPEGMILSAGDGFTVTTNGQVIEGRDIRGAITVRANDVTIRRSRITHSATAIAVEDGFTNLTVEDVTIVGLEVTDATGAIRVGAASIVVRRVDLSGYAEGILLIGGGGLIEDNYFHDLPDLVGGDTIEVWTGQGLVIRHNRLERMGGNSVIKLPADVPAPHGDDILIDDNLIAGGGWSVYGGDDPGRPDEIWTNVRITDNRFSVRYHERCGHWGPIANSDSAVTTGNVWHESGEPLSEAPPPRP